MTITAASPLTGTRREPSGGAVIGKPGHARGDDAFANAERHSRRVRALKIVLPTIGVLIVAAFVIYSYLLTPPSVSVDVAGTAIRDGKLVMANPKMEGFTRDKLPYSMTAIRAIQDLSNTGAITLEQIGAKLPVSEDNIATIDAAAGLYDREKNTLDITSEMTITTSDGMVARFQSAFFDIGTGNLKTGEPVDIKTAGSRIAADSLEVTEGGKVLVFESRVRVQVDRRKLAARAESGGENVSN